jgi:monofunctional biosynthetic peptidoglycan transglycosylase
MQLAVIAAEDQKFPRHFGFDLSAIRDAVEQNSLYGTSRGASTITQQVAKNLFLWPSKSIIRKGLEAYLTLWMELLWPKERILEIYLNTAQFDSHIFGVGSAGQYFFNRVPSDFTFYQSALLAAVLPNPVRYSVENPSSYLYERVGWIQSQMRELGYEYLKQM